MVQLVNDPQVCLTLRLILVKRECRNPRHYTWTQQLHPCVHSKCCVGFFFLLFFKPWLILKIRNSEVSYVKFVLPSSCTYWNNARQLVLLSFWKTLCQSVLPSSGLRRKMPTFPSGISDSFFDDCVCAQWELDGRVGADVTGVPGRGRPHWQRLPLGNTWDVPAKTQVVW